MDDLEFAVGDSVWVFRGDAWVPGTIEEIERDDDEMPYRVTAPDPDGGNPYRAWVTQSCVSRHPDNRNHVEPNIKRGDVVMLRSGGPWMTVAQLNGSEIGCAWFSGDGEILRREYFPDECLKKVEAEHV